MQFKMSENNASLKRLCSSYNLYIIHIIIHHTSYQIYKSFNLIVKKIRVEYENDANFHQYFFS